QTSEERRRFGVARRVTNQLSPRLVGVGPASEVVAVVERSDRALERQDLQPVPRELEIANDLGSEQAYHVRENREFESWKYFFGDGRPTDERTSLQHEGLSPGAREVRRGDEAVVPAADDDRIVLLAAHAR